MKNLKLPKWYKILYFKEKLTKNLNYQNEMSEMSWAVFLGLTLIVCTKLNKVELSLWDLTYYIALRELKHAIYDGLKMKLKFTKMSFEMTMSSLQCDDDEWSVGLSWLLRLLWMYGMGSSMESKMSLKMSWRTNFLKEVSHGDVALSLWR